MSTDRILITDDDVNICQLINLYLIKEGYLVDIVHNGKDALDQIQTKDFDLVLLDIMMPIMDGMETLKQIRSFSDVPVILLSAKGEPIDKIVGLEYGADDYVTKPFEPQELICRIKAILRRINKRPLSSSKDITVSNLYVSCDNYIVKIDGEKIDMTPKEIELLYFLMSNPMKVFTREQLMESVWKTDGSGDSRTVDVHIKRIREKINESDHWRLVTVWRVGYKFEVL